VSPVYFCDRNLGKRFGQELRRQGLVVELHDDHFPQDTPDEDLLRHVAAQGWVILTLDKRMRYREESPSPTKRHPAARAEAGPAGRIGPPVSGREGP
jgi:hypothetical protein